MAMDPIKDGGNWYQYCYSSPIIYMDPNGLLVVGFGAEYAGSIGARGAEGVQIIIDKNFNLGIMRYTAIGGGLVAKASSSLTGSFTFGADTIDDLVGTSSGVGASGGNGFSGGGDVSFGKTEDGRFVTQITVSGGLGVSPAPLEMHGQTIVASVYSFKDIQDYVNNILWEAFGKDLHDAFMKSMVSYYFKKYGGCGLP